MRAWISIRFRFWGCFGGHPRIIFMVYYVVSLELDSCRNRSRLSRELQQSHQRPAARGAWPRYVS